MMRGTEKKIYQFHAEFCKTFSHPIRLAIIDLLRNGEKNVAELQKELGIRQTTISQHLAVLRRIGAVIARNEGRVVYYKLADERIIKAYDMLDKVIKDIRTKEAKILAK
ncbi:MAG TPA: ArsR family transcriptional regulator [Candidatus Caldiarchaeum subterraneum]|uniref:ArsR family transcriptional regulator n=1 Tax=Caldiarchaeum subterraneum TaxID=311458 RepID=A0A832ZY19_CALS0|nr:ArsR family transcriptional regulator [Candidatus Caldarchaeum subterraneum]